MPPQDEMDPDRSAHPASIPMVLGGVVSGEIIDVIDPTADADADAASEFDRDIQQRADFVREALRVEANNRAMGRLICGFLYPEVMPTPPGNEWRSSGDPTEAEGDPRAERARVAARVAAYERRGRIFASDLPSSDLREANEQARWLAFSVDKGVIEGDYPGNEGGK